MDETEFSIDVGRHQWMVTKTLDQQAYLASSNNFKYLTVVECISGNGVFLPSIVIVPGIMQMKDWFTRINLPDSYLVATLEFDYSNDVLTMKWLRHFNCFSKQRLAGTYRLLVLDGYGSHYTLKFIQYCNKEKIIPFCLPAHITHLLQPLNVVIFQPYKHWHVELLDQATRSGCHDYNKVKFLHSLPTF